MKSNFICRLETSAFVVLIVQVKLNRGENQWGTTIHVYVLKLDKEGKVSSTTIWSQNKWYATRLSGKETLIVVMVVVVVRF